MALTASVKEELSRLDIKKSSVRKAEVSAMLRFAGDFTSSRAGSSSRPKWIWRPPPGACAPPSPRSTGTRARSSSSPAAACAAAAGTLSASSATARRWHGRQASLTAGTARARAAVRRRQRLSR